jgi:adenylate cyclase
MAEVELGSEDEIFEVPEWAGDEVTGDPRYYNANLARHPYKRW